MRSGLKDLRQCLGIGLCTLVGLSAWTAYADEDDSKRIIVPPSLRDKGMQLVVMEESYSLDQDVIEMKSPYDIASTMLLDRRGRIMNFSSGTNIDRTMFDEFRPRAWRVGLLLGGVRSSSREWEETFLDSGHSKFGLDVLHQPTEWGVLFTYASVSNASSRIEGLTVGYESEIYQLGASYEWAPWTRGATSMWGKIHIAALAGVSHSRDRLEMRDTELKISAKSASTAPFYGFDLRIPTSNNLWINLRMEQHYLAINFAEFDFKTKAPTTHSTIGGAYAF